MSKILQILSLVLLSTIVLMLPAPASADADAFDLKMWRVGSLRQLGDTAKLVWTLTPAYDAEDDLAYVIGYLYPGLRLDGLEASAKGECSATLSGFDCRSVGLMETTVFTATVTVVGPGELFGANGEVAYAHAVVGAFGGGSFGHTLLQDRAPTAIADGREPDRKHRIFFPEVKNGN